MRVGLRSVVLNSRGASGDWDDLCELPVWVDSSVKSARSVSRLVTGSGRVLARPLGFAPRTVALSIEACDRHVADWIESRLGVLLCLRDPEGLKMFGSVDGFDRAKRKARGELWDVSCTFTETSFSEAV